MLRHLHLPFPGHFPPGGVSLAVHPSEALAVVGGTAAKQQPNGMN